MPVKEFVQNIDKGFYHTARVQKLTPGQLMVKEVAPEPEEVMGAYDRIIDRFGLPKQATGILNARLKVHAAEVAALEKCLEVKRIQGRDTMEKSFFTSANDTALFPQFLATTIITGLLAQSLVARLSAMEERVEGQTADKITMSESEGDRQLKLTGEGAQLPETKITRAEGTVRLFKYGRMLTWTYEAVRRQRVDAIGIMLQRMGGQIGIDETDDLLEILIAGDGTSGSAVTDTDAEVSGTLDYDELVRLQQAFPKGYRMDNMVAPDALIRTILNMSEFKDPLVQVRFQENGGADEIPLLGGTLHRWTSTNSTSFSTDRIVAVDSRYAIGTLMDGDMLEESDALIDRQINRRTMSYWKGYKKLDVNASQCLDVTA
jgi:hypothetical protein